MKTAKHPEIASTTVTIPCPSYGTLIAREKARIPYWVEELKKANKKKQGSLEWARRRNKK